MFKNYIDYLKDNPKGYWFKKKAYGWGWAPARWEGWLVLGVYLVILGSFFTKEGTVAPLGSDTLASLAVPFISTIILISICYAKGEKPGWQWGINKK